MKSCKPRTKVLKKNKVYKSKGKPTVIMSSKLIKGK